MKPNISPVKMVQTPPTDQPHTIGLVLKRASKTFSRVSVPFTYLTDPKPDGTLQFQPYKVRGRQLSWSSSKQEAQTSLWNYGAEETIDLVG